MQDPYLNISVHNYTFNGASLFYFLLYYSVSVKIDI